MIESKKFIRFSVDARPILLIAVHTEEEFDWSKPFDRLNTSVTHMPELVRLHDTFLKHGAFGTYLIDYPVASDEASVGILSKILTTGSAAIGAHLHPWVNPPFAETVCPHNSYPGNLSRELEKDKLRTLTTQIERHLGERPKAYLAGRYGFGEHSLSVLQELQYRMDLSGVAMGDFRGDGGPDFRSLDNSCFWEGIPSILRVPHTTADIGLLCRNGRRLIDVNQNSAMRRLRVPGILSYLGGVRRVRLTPEGFSLREMMAGARALIAAGIRVLVFSFHSPSLVPGFTPYVRDRHDRAEFLSRINGFLKFFKEECGGRFGGPEAVFAAAGASKGIDRGT
jgi:hypothetical protein